MNNNDNYDWKKRKMYWYLKALKAETNYSDYTNRKKGRD